MIHNDRRVAETNTVKRPRSSATSRFARAHTRVSGFSFQSRKSGTLRHRFANAGSRPRLRTRNAKERSLALVQPGVFPLALRYRTIITRYDGNVRISRYAYQPGYFNIFHALRNITVTPRRIALSSFPARSRDLFLAN